MNDWIDVKNKLPPNSRIVLGYTPVDDYMFVGFYEEYNYDDKKHDKWYIITAMRSTRIMKKKVTHWMELPSKPKIKEDISGNNC